MQFSMAFRPTTANRYPDEFRRAAVKRVLIDGEKIHPLAAELGIGSASLADWVRDPKLGGNPGYKGVAGRPKAGASPAHYDAAGIRAAVARVLAGEPCRPVAKECGWAPSSLARWCRDSDFGGDPKYRPQEKFGGKAQHGKPKPSKKNLPEGKTGASERYFDTATKIAAVKRIFAGELMVKVREELGCNQGALRKWARDPAYGGDPNFDGSARAAVLRFGFTDELKTAIVKRILAGERAYAVGKEIGSNATTLLAWARDPRYGGDPSYRPGLGRGTARKAPSPDLPQSPLPLVPISQPQKRTTGTRINFCPQCGGDLKRAPADAKFCLHCGASLKGIRL
jgi:transposase-like protein